jgi:uncharacterized protein YndB with AHSA1/START domain
MYPMATLDEIGGKAVLRFERRLAHPPEKVFRAISEPAELAHWFPASVELELRPGAPIRFTFEEHDVDGGTGEVIEAEPPRLLVYSWGDGMLRWEVVPDGAGCRLHFTHTLGAGGGWGGRLAAARHAAGWDECLAGLEARLDGADPDGPGWFERSEAYVERFGLGEGRVRDGHEVIFERDLVQPAAEVWSTLTEGAEPGVGDDPPAGFTIAAFPAGPVTAAEPGRVLEYDAAPAGRVRWELLEHDFGCGLVLTHTLRDGQRVALDEWKARLQQLVAQLHGVER